MLKHKEASRPGALYWVVTGLMLLFGVVSLPSIGLLFLALGIAMVFLADRRADPKIFWPVLIGALAAIGTYAVASPWSCSSGSGPGMTCRNLVGARFLADGNGPASWPFLVAALGIGAAAFGLARVTVRR